MAMTVSGSVPGSGTELKDKSSMGGVLYVRAEVLSVSNRMLAIPFALRLKTCADGAKVVPSPVLVKTELEADRAVAVHAGPVLSGLI